MNELFNALHRGTRAGQLANNLEGRAIAPALAVVTANADPEDRRRVKVALPQAPAIESPWLRRSLPYPWVDPPMPSIGQTVLVFYIDGDTTAGWYQSVGNDTNPAMGKADAVADYWDEVPGNRSLSTRKDFDEATGGDHTSTVKGDVLVKGSKKLTMEANQQITIDGGARVLIRNDAGASFELTATGFVIFRDVLGHEVRLGQNGALTWEAPTINFISSSMTINGNQIATVGANDSRGDTLTSRGW